MQADFDLPKWTNSRKQKQEVELWCRGRDREKRIWRLSSVADGPIWTKFGKVWGVYCLNFYLLSFRPLLSKTVNRLRQIYNNKLKSPLFGFLSSPYFSHDASCVVLNTDWSGRPCLLCYLGNFVTTIMAVCAINCDSFDLIIIIYLLLGTI